MKEELKLEIKAEQAGRPTLCTLCTLHPQRPPCNLCLPHPCPTCVLRRSKLRGGGSRGGSAEPRLLASPGQLDSQPCLRG